jgi:UMF1 family MFS transporter
MNISDLPTKQRKTIRAWCMFDWANSAFATSGIAAIYPIYFITLFKDSVGESTTLFGFVLTGSSMWSLGIAFSTMIVAITSPLLGIVADRVPIKKTLLWIYTVFGASFAVLAFFSTYTPVPWFFLLATFIFANLGFAGGLVFYNAFLPHIAPKELLDDVSSRGFAYGYVGGGLLLLIHLVINLLFSESDLLDLVTRLSMASIGLWWLAWSIWTMKVLEEPKIENPQHGLTVRKAANLAFKEIGKTFGEIRKFRVVLIYLVAYLVFNDGIQTVMGIAGAFAADTLGLALVFNMATILIIQFVAAGGSMVFSRLAQAISTKKALSISLIGWIFIVIMGVSVSPIAPNSHHSYDYQLEYNEGNRNYIVTEAPTLEETELNRPWIIEVGAINKGDGLNIKSTSTLVEAMDEFPKARHSLSIKGGSLDGLTSIGIMHPSSLGKGALDWWPSIIRKVIWAPMNLDAGFQWLILGVCVGLVMGGSQALARSLFAQIVPETRSGEFFSFFGFMGRASSVIGPMLFILVTGVIDQRTAVFSIVILIIIGTTILKWVNVESGIATAQVEDETVRSHANS